MLVLILWVCRRVFVRASSSLTAWRTSLWRRTIVRPGVMGSSSGWGRTQWVVATSAASRTFWMSTRATSAGTAPTLVVTRESAILSTLYGSSLTRPLSRGLPRYVHFHSRLTPINSNTGPSSEVRGQVVGRGRHHGTPHRVLNHQRGGAALLCNQDRDWCLEEYQ